VFNWATALGKAIKAATHDDVMTSRIRNAEWGMPNAQNRGGPWEEGLVGLPGVKRGVLLEGQLVGKFGRAHNLRSFKLWKGKVLFVSGHQIVSASR
jgi:hypothetical protein